MAIKLYTPQLQVSLFKVVQRQNGNATRTSAAPRAIDLTSYLGMAGTVNTIKDIRQPCGAFSLTFADRVDPDTQDSLYAKIEPMDVVEIRASRAPHLYAGQDLPLIMRGFVSQIRRVESIADDGKPQRVVVVSGHDSGKLLQIYQVLWELAQLTDKPFVDNFSFQVAAGMQVNYLPVSDFMTQLITRVVNKKVEQLAAFSGQRIQPFSVQASVTGPGYVSPTLLGGMFGPHWNIIETFADRPWNEVFVQDSEAGPVLVFRPTPFYDINGSLIGGAADPGSCPIDISLVVSLDVSRSDANVANFYWVPPDASSFDTSSFLTASRLQNGDLLDTTYSNNNPVLFGTKKMAAATHLVPVGGAMVPAIPVAQRGQALSGYVQWHVQRAALLKQMNRDNGVLEDGSAVIQGSEMVQPGTYLIITRGSTTAKLYMPSVSHNFGPLSGWTSSVRLERGTGFLDRNKMQGSPQWAEGRGGVYS